MEWADCAEVLTASLDPMALLWNALPILHAFLLTSIWNHIISKSNNFNENSCPQSYSNTVVQKHFFKEKLEPV